MTHRYRRHERDIRFDAVNGGVKIEVPTRNDAQLETGTVNGRLDPDFPATASGPLGRSISTPLGAGGAPIRVMTTDGGVSLRRL